MLLILISQMYISLQVATTAKIVTAKGCQKKHMDYSRIGA